MKNKKLIILIMTVVMLLSLITGCSANKEKTRTSDIAILYTGDVHCAVDENIGYAGLAAYKNKLISEGCEVMLVDSGDSIQGESIGSFSKGESIITLMNTLGYNAMALGNHEFDYGGIEQLNKLAEVAEFPFLSVNLRSTQTNTSVFDSYTIVERDGVKIAFVGVSTPTTITSSTPAYFMDDNGEFIFDFMADSDGQMLWTAVQDSVDEARESGADYIVALTHLGIGASSSPFTSGELIEHTSGIDVVLDGHSHSVIECERVKNKDGDWVLLSATGTKLEHIGLLMLDKEGNISTGLLSNSIDGDAEITSMIDSIKSEYSELLNTVTAHLETSLTTDDPETGIRIVRVAETNLGDLCADAYRYAGDADIGFINGGGIRASLTEGDITYGDILSVNPFGNLLCKVSVTGQTILDALEFGARKLPEDNGGFLQVSGITYEININIESSVKTDDNGLFVSVEGEYRVQNVTVGGEPLLLDKEYTLVSHNYMVKNLGDGYTMFSGCKMLMDEFIVDSDALIEYINNEYKANAQQYINPYGNGRIIAISE